MGVVSQIKDLDNTSSLPASLASLCEIYHYYLIKSFYQELVSTKNLIRRIAGIRFSGLQFLFLKADRKSVV